MCSPQSGPLREIHGVIREDKREEGDRGDQEEKRGDSKGERQIQPVISSLNVLHSPEHTERFTELGSEEEERGDRADLVEKKESQKGERGIKLVITLPSKNGY